MLEYLDARYQLERRLMELLHEWHISLSLTAVLGTLVLDTSYYKWHVEL